MVGRIASLGILILLWSTPAPAQAQVKGTPTLASVRSAAGAEPASRRDGTLDLSLWVKQPGRSIPAAKLRLVPVAAPGPHIQSLDLLDVTDALLVDAPERRLFDLQNPEEGTWTGTGKVRLRLFAQWADPAPAQYTLELNAGMARKLGTKRGDELRLDPQIRARGVP